MSVATTWLRYHANEAATVDELREEIVKWRSLCEWAYQVTSDALMISAQKPREARAARDNAICDINKRLGGLVR